MNFINKYLNKFNQSIISLIMFALSAFVIIRTFMLVNGLAQAAENQADNMGMLLSAISGAKTIVYLIIFLGIVALVQGIGCIIQYAHNHERDLCYIIYFMSSAALVYTALKVISFTSNISSLLGQGLEGMGGLLGGGSNGAEMLGLIPNAINLYTDIFPIAGIIIYSLIGAIGTGIYAGYLMYTLKLHPIQRTYLENSEVAAKPSEYEISENDRRVFESDVEKAKEATKTLVEKIRGLSRKQKVGIISVIAVCIVGFAGFKIYNTFFNFDEIDLMGQMTQPTFSGYDGDGSIDTYPGMGNIDYYRTKPGIEEFINSVTYKVDKEEGLSNGDKVTVTAEYSAETAKSLKIKVIKDSVTVKVTGLIGRFKDGNDIGKKDVKLIETAMDAVAKTAVDDNYDYRDETYTFKRLALLYAREDKREYDDGTYNDKVLGVYQTVCGEDTEYFVVESYGSVNSQTDFENVEYSAGYFDDHFAYMLKPYLEEDSGYTLTEVDATEKKCKSIEEWYSDNFVAVATVVYPATVHPSLRADFWEVIVKGNTVTYEYTFDQKYDKDERGETEEEIREAMEDEVLAFEKVASMLEEKSGIKGVTVKVKYIDKKDTVLYSRDFTKNESR